MPVSKCYVMLVYMAAGSPDIALDIGLLDH